MRKFDEIFNHFIANWLKNFNLLYYKSLQWCIAGYMHQYKKCR